MELKIKKGNKVSLILFLTLLFLVILGMNSKANAAKNTILRTYYANKGTEIKVECGNVSSYNNMVYSKPSSSTALKNHGWEYISQNKNVKIPYNARDGFYYLMSNSNNYPISAEWIEVKVIPKTVLCNENGRLFEKDSYHVGSKWQIYSKTTNGKSDISNLKKSWGSGTHYYTSDLSFKSSNNKIATVDKNGMITVKGEGTCVITMERKITDVHVINGKTHTAVSKLYSSTNFKAIKVASTQKPQTQKPQTQKPSTSTQKPSTTKPSSSSTQIKTFTVKFNANGGTGSMSDQKITHGDYNKNTLTKLRKNTFTKSGYKFKGWYAKRSADGFWYGYNSKGVKGWYKSPDKKAMYGDEAGVARTVAPGASVTMYAQWEKISTTKPTTTKPTQTTQLQLGDVNGDKKVDREDAQMILEYSTGSINLTNEQKTRADYNKDGLINSNDALAILKEVSNSSNQNVTNKDTANLKVGDKLKMKSGSSWWTYTKYSSQDVNSGTQYRALLSNDIVKIESIDGNWLKVRIVSLGTTTSKGNFKVGDIYYIYYGSSASKYLIKQ